MTILIDEFQERRFYAEIGVKPIAVQVDAT
jgi:hypothetical protein